MTERIVLPLKGEYFDAIQCGEKIEEYRLCNDYWKKRLVGRHYDEIIFTRGYPKRGDESKRMYFLYSGYSIKIITHKHFGCNPVEVFAIRFHDIPSELDKALYRAGLYRSGIAA